jgi:hypothetical protein
MATKTEHLVIRMTPELRKKLQQLADQDHRKLSDFIHLQLEKLVETKEPDKRQE